jgi:hypothetical protein
MGNRMKTKEAAKSYADTTQASQTTVNTKI